MSERPPYLLYYVIAYALGVWSAAITFPILLRVVNALFGATRQGPASNLMLEIVFTALALGATVWPAMALCVCVARVLDVRSAFFYPVAGALIGVLFLSIFYKDGSGLLAVPALASGVAGGFAFNWVDRVHRS
jgi:uncharacterized membrane protein YhaH (DUF805 family)